MPILTSRERVEKAINHEEPDRVPMDLVLTSDAYVNLVKHMGLENEVSTERNFTNWLTYAAVDLKVLRALDVDCVHLGSKNPTGFPKWLNDGSYVDEWGLRRAPIKRDNGSFYYEIVDAPLKEPTLAALDDFPWPDPTDDSVLEGLEEKMTWWRENTDLAIIAWFDRGGLGEFASYLRGLQDWCLDLVRRPEFAVKLLNKLADISIEYNRRGIERMGRRLSILRFSGWDLGTQLNLIYSPKVCREIFQPIMRRVWGETKANLNRVNPRAKIYVHSCGAIYSLLPMFVECGLDILDPIQTSAKGMDTKKIKENFGRDLSFHGAIDIQQFLPNATVPEVWAEVKRVIGDLGPGGGYVMAPGHAIQEDVPPANIVAMYQAGKTLGVYPLV
ncbi:MAG: hypothetical protein LBJ64_06750 [Deltaproteobacteria bacterium]|jgi:uroporphyrinogen decarboxylase|nr:hypothetical protein [Deltaproteobacteria bacterium]